MLRPESWAVIGAAALGIVAALMAFIKTPPGRRFRLARPSLEEQVAASPPEARAVILRADRKRALRQDLPWLLAMVPLAAFAGWISRTGVEACATLFGVGRLDWLVWAFFALPLLVAAGLAVAARHTLAVLRGGYWPPLDTPVYRDTLARTGRLTRWRAIASLVLIALSATILAYGYARTLQFAERSGAWERIQAATAACARS